MTTKTCVRTGLDNLVSNNFQSLAGMTVGLLANQASVDKDVYHIADRILQCPSVKLVKLFAPEHGFWGTAQDMAVIADDVDKRTGLPVISVYGSSHDSLFPQEAWLSDLDAVIVDLQDIGSRYYTFAQTLGYFMQVAKKTGTKVVVIDRPNPINGVTIEGSTLLETCRSFCGYAPITNRHGLTMGEIALMMNNGFAGVGSSIPAINCDLEIIKVTGWSREMYYDQTGLPWVLPSPNMPTLDTAIVYPGACLFEAITASEARGTTRPFELLGSPEIDAVDWVEETVKVGIGMNGCTLRPTSFIPGFQKHAGKTCTGVQIHVTDRKCFQPYRLTIALLVALRNISPTACSLRSQAYEFVKDVTAMDLLHGSDKLRLLLDGKESLKHVLEQLSDAEETFRKQRQPFLLY